MNLNNKVVVISGAGSGIGRALAVGFCNDNAHVVGFSRTEKDLLETVSLCNGRMDYMVANVTSEDDVKRIFEKTVDKYGKVDILINNAGKNLGKRHFFTRSHNEWLEVINVNLVGVALCCRIALPYMLEKGYGRIINITSRRAEAPNPDTSYSVSKAAVGVFTKALAIEVNRNSCPDILINDLIPGSVKTGMNSNGSQDPMEIYPHARFLATLPAGGPSGKVFFKSKPYELHSKPNKNIFKSAFKSLINKISIKSF